MCSCKILVLLAAVVCAAQAYQAQAYQGYNGQEITMRAAERTVYETQLKVSCETGDDLACFQHFVSVNRMWIAIGGAILGALIIVGICICICCCCCKKRHHRLSSSRA